MNEQLLIRIDADGALAWQQVGAGARGRGAPPPTVRDAATRIVALVPGTDVLLTRVDLPPASTGRLAQILPYALEDQLLDDVQNLHFAAGGRDAEGRQVAAVVSRAQMQAWVDCLAEAGVAADVMLPDVLAVPLHDAQPTALLHKGSCRVRLGSDAGFVCAFDQLPLWLADQQRVQLLASPGEPNCGRTDSCIVATHRVDPDEVWASGLDDEPPVNLLCGDYEPRHRHAPMRRLWRFAALLFAVAIGLGVAVHVTSIVRLQAANAELDQAIQKHYADLFPDSPPVPDPVARVRSELSRMGASTEPGSGGLLDLLGRSGPILISHDFRLQLLGMEYRNHALEVSVQAPGLSNLDQLRERLSTLPGMDVELSSATPGEDGIRGRIRIAGDGA